MADKPPEKPPTKTKRFFKLAGMTASVVGNYAKSKVQSVFLSKEDADLAREEAHKKSGDLLAKTLGELKGAVMKVGQMATLAHDILPKELSNALTTLQNEALPMDFEVIRQQIESEFGAPPETLFDSFVEEPFASASIGQVHRARTDDGREVIVKVQYPGVDGAVDSDLGHLKIALRASGLIQLSRKELNDAFEEIRDRLVEELDYTIEAENVRKFRKHHEKHPFVIIPDVVGERSSKRVLTLTYEPGDHLNDLKNLGYSQDVLNKLGMHFFHVILSQIFELQAVHADPNPANFAFRPDGSVVLYDFGCVKELPEHFVGAYKKIIDAALKEDYQEAEEALHDLGLRNPDGPPVEFEYYKQWRDLLIKPFEVGEFDYGNTNIHDQLLKMIPGVLKRMTSFRASKDMIFVNRVVGGHYGTLRILQSKGRFLDLVKDYVYA